MKGDENDVAISAAHSAAAGEGDDFEEESNYSDQPESEDLRSSRSADIAEDEEDDFEDESGRSAPDEGGDEHPDDDAEELLTVEDKLALDDSDIDPESIYDLDDGGKLSGRMSRDSGALPFQSRITSASDFFATEILYRFDILHLHERESIRGRFRVELKGYRGGIWTVEVGDEINVVNRREDAEIVLAMQQNDFLQILNGELNPQLAVLARKVRITGDVRKAVAFHCLLAPEGD